MIIAIAGLRARRAAGQRWLLIAFAAVLAVGNDVAESQQVRTPERAAVSPPSVDVVYDAAATFLQQGPKLLGTDVVGQATQGSSVSLSADGNTAIVGGSDNGRGRVDLDAERRGLDPAGTQAGRHGRRGAADQGNSVSLSADGNTAIVGGPRDNDDAGAAWVWTRSGKESGPSRDPSWSARAPWGSRSQGFPCPSPPTATPPSSEGSPTTTVRWGRVGLDQERRRLDPAGTQAGRLGRRGGRPPRVFRVPLRRRQHRHRRRGRRQRWRWGRVGLDEERRRLDPAGTQAGRLGRRGERRPRLFRVPLRRRQHRHRRRDRRQR